MGCKYHSERLNLNKILSQIRIWFAFLFDIELMPDDDLMKGVNVTRLPFLHSAEQVLKCHRVPARIKRNNPQRRQIHLTLIYRANVLSLVVRFAPGTCTFLLHFAQLHTCEVVNAV